VNFIPWRGDFTRGIFVSSCTTVDLPLEAVKKIYEDYYQGHAFTFFSSGPIDLKQVVNTNKCIIGLEQEGDKLVIHSALDNLLKGASGQAVQNMNLMFGQDEREGLRLKSTVF
jgi:N-acetyl-gamma-glutamyl-phosphate reductase